MKENDLYGTWKYIKVEDPNTHPPDTTSAEEIKFADPSITFHPNGKLEMIWEGKTLSHGTYKIDGNMIRYHELLDSGRTHDFPFLVSELSDSKIVFETMRREEATKVTAIKAK
ncbi:hypothetical protein GS399_14810 [Pedobacter sp. HMF7647]|uniref:Lipocalin-like domain-containing protein n=1 Tax=Hufsiella arboris TaxID=2695275 RepID=A0A7K1YCD8_9SPHI|nr:hypothetical protein [Hufsiella arboris]MXV52247.1 hypothetical protein [Hufsiella arboris]